jgi:hypothetical protein
MQMQFFTIWLWNSRNCGVRANYKNVRAMAPKTFTMGHPALPGKTARSIFLANADSGSTIHARRGPPQRFMRSESNNICISHRSKDKPPPATKPAT